MKNQKRLSKCVDRYLIVEKTNEQYITKGKVFDKTIVISTPNIDYGEVAQINAEIVKSAKFFEEINIKEPKNFVSWLKYYMNNIKFSIHVSISGQPVLI